MSEFKDISSEEKITHYLAGELSVEEKAEFDLELKKDTNLAKEFKASQALISLMNADKNTLSVEGGIGTERRNKIFGNQNSTQESSKNNQRIIDIFKHLKFALVAAALIILSYAFFPEIWKNGNEATTPIKPNHPSAVAGVRSFNMALPSGRYHFTLISGHLNVDKIDSLEGDDYFKKEGVKAGDQILKINGIEMGSFKSEELNSLLTSLLDKPSVYLQIRRNGQILPASNLQP